MLQLVASMRSYALERKSRVVGVEVGSDVSGKILEIIFFSSNECFTCQWEAANRRIIQEENGVSL